MVHSSVGIRVEKVAGFNLYSFGLLKLINSDFCIFTEKLDFFKYSVHILHVRIQKSRFPNEDRTLYDVKHKIGCHSNEITGSETNSTFKKNPLLYN